MNTQTAISAGIKAAQDVSALLRARNPLFWIVSREEPRVLRSLFEASAAASYELIVWNCATGMSKFDGAQVNRLTDPGEALNAIRGASTRALYVMCDLPYWLKDPTVLRSLRCLADSLPMAPREQARAIAIVTPSSEVPPELADDAIVIDWPLPDRSEIGELLDSAITALPDDIKATAAPNGTREAAIDAAVGLSAKEATACYAKSIVSSRKIDPQAVASEKKRVIARDGALEYVDPLPGGLDALGGHADFKVWVNQRKLAFSPRARAYGLPAPKGVFLVGQPGTGKTRLAHAIATAYGVPLIIWDMGAGKSKFVGESEANFRKSQKVIESVGRCVVLIDEIEKAFAGATQGGADGGVSTDQLGSFLSWQQSRTCEAFVVATANEVESLPPAMLRKGRFDEIFYTDLPTASERTEILKAALASYNRAPAGIDFAELARLSAKFVGAEIAACVPSAMFAAFADGEREITTQDLAQAMRETVPLAATAAEKVEALRKWATGRARPTSSYVETTQQQARQLDV